ncbi:MAG TPA: hypothetical protein PKL73_09560 [Polyangiaceae bacterium]|jgi:hypothetical protein|nr:MAG: hypothetical protein BWY17_05136 [Deltaproteobacteria bacterium ADurb.Bin207]HNS97182.1 hypothetical protein [Polyangiaceae bacterium]HNZ23563.1 hypothetical protein [Polyangiaceae bacterium]HOD24229.1 hypothetical protein [Polyangiaceae bacterium]HOE51554.1 hypothetical protein [Polyangiaceae bacterium]
MADSQQDDKNQGSPSENKMTLFRDDRSEDIGAILLAAVVIVTIVVLTMGKNPSSSNAPSPSSSAATSAGSVENPPASSRP